MDAHADQFGLLAELAIAVAGFSGVAAAFSGHDRSYRFFERTRLLALFINSGAILSGCGVVHTLLMTDATPATAIRWASLATAIVLGVPGIPAMIRIVRAARAPDSPASPWAIRVTVVYMAISLALLGLNVWMGAATLLVGVLWILLLYGLWMFSRLLTLAN